MPSGRDVRVTVGTVWGFQQGLTVPDGVGVTDAASWLVGAVRGLADPVGVTDSVSASLSSGAGFGSSFGASFGG